MLSTQAGKCRQKPAGSREAILSRQLRSEVHLRSAVIARIALRAAGEQRRRLWQLYHKHLHWVCRKELICYTTPEMVTSVSLLDSYYWTFRFWHNWDLLTGVESKDTQIVVSLITFSRSEHLWYSPCVRKNRCMCISFALWRDFFQRCTEATALWLQVLRSQSCVPQPLRRWKRAVHTSRHLFGCLLVTVEIMTLNDDWRGKVDACITVLFYFFLWIYS
jgi:hypothetical protein